MDALDLTLSHMTDNDWDIRAAPPLERLVHALHMLGTWELAAPFYQRFTRMQRNSRNKRERFSRLCPCLTSVHENGVWRNLENLAGRIRNVEDPVTRTVSPRYQAITDYPYEEEEYEYPWYWRDNAETTRPAPEVPVTPLTTEAEWEVWKAGLDMREGGEQRSRELALFLFCSLHYPDADTV